MSNQEWLESLKPGDKVAIPVKYGDNYSIRTVDRVTNTQIVVNGCKYRKTSGYLVSSDKFYTERIIPVSERVLQANKDHARKMRFKKINFNPSNFTLDQMDQLSDLVESFKNE